IGSEHATETAKGMTGHRMRSRIGRLVATLPPSEQQPRDNHDQCDLQNEPEQRGKADHAAEEPMSKQQAEQPGAEETARDTGEQSAAKQTGTRCCLASRAGSSGLRECALHRR